MRKSVPLPPFAAVPSPRDTKQWMVDVSSFLQSVVGDGGLLPKVILLESWTATAKATVDGVLMFDPTLGQVVVSVAGAWVPLATGGGGGGGGVAWGAITGTLSAQTDLQAALDAKANITAKGTGTLTIPTARYEHYEVIAATGVVASDTVIVWLAPGTDQDENTVDFIDLVAMSASPLIGQLAVTAAFSAPTSGPILVNWSVQ